MQEVIQLASEIYMIVLCLLAGPSDFKEIRIDQVSSRGLMDTLLVQRTAEGYVVYDERGGRRIPFTTLRRPPGKPGVFVAKGPNGQEEVIDLTAEIANLETLNARRRGGKQVLKIKGGSEIHIARSGFVTYLSEVRSDRTYVVHRDEPFLEKAATPKAASETRVYTLKYGAATKLSEIIKPILDQTGLVASDERSSSLVVTTTPEFLETVAQIIARLDVKQNRIELKP